MHKRKKKGKREEEGEGGIERKNTHHKIENLTYIQYINITQMLHIYSYHVIRLNY